MAGVAISLTIGQNGIFARAQNAVNVYEKATTNEQSELNKVADIIDGYLPKPGKTLVEAFKAGEIEVGDYVTNYNSKLKNSSATVSLGEEETGHAGTQTYKVDNTTTWRVLGLSSDETQLILTTGSPIKKVMNSSGAEEWEKDPYLYLNNAEGWYHTNDELTDDNILDRVCKIYDSNLAADVRSMRIEDIMNLLGIRIEENKAYKSDGEGGETELSSSEFQSFVGTSYEYDASNDWAPENYLKEKYPSNSEYQNLETKYVGDTVDGTAFMFPYSSPNIIDSSSKLYEILFSGTTSEEGNSKAYWLASPGVGVNDSLCDFGPGAVRGGVAGSGFVLFDSYGYSVEFWLGVRPVVYLDSNVTVNDLTISKTGVEEQWTTTVPNSYSGVDLQYGRVTMRPGTEK